VRQVTAESLAQLRDAAKLADPRNVWLKKYLPDFMFEEPVLLMNWQWCALLLAVFFGFVLDFTARFVFVRGIRRLLNRGGIDINPRTLRAVFRPVGLLCASLFWMAVLPSIGLPSDAHAILHVAVTFLAGAAGVWAAYRAVEILTEYLSAKASRTESRYDDLLVPLISKTAKVFILAFGVVFVAGNLDVNISSLLAGLGLGGLAFALAAKDTVSNLFGIFKHTIRRTMRRNHPGFMGNSQGVQHFSGVLHGFPVGLGAHDNTYEHLFIHGNNSCQESKNGNHAFYQHMRPTDIARIQYNRKSVHLPGHSLCRLTENCWKSFAARSARRHSHACHPPDWKN